MHIGLGKVSLSAVVLLTAACAVPSAKDVVIHGRITDGSGAAVTGVKLYIADLKYEPNLSGMPNVGEHAFVYTNAEGQYSVTFGKLHSAVSITVYGQPPCPPVVDAAMISSDVYAGTHELRRDFMYCVGTANNRWRGP